MNAMRGRRGWCVILRWREEPRTLRLLDCDDGGREAEMEAPTAHNQQCWFARTSSRPTAFLLYPLFERSEGLGLDMSRWSKQFEENQIHQTLKQLSDWLSTAVKDIDADHEAERRRLKKSMSTILEVVGGLDPEMFPDQQLSQLNQHLRQAPIWNN